MTRNHIRELFRRLLALAAAAGTLWAAAVTAGSTTFGESTAALQSALPIQALRWELGDLAQKDSLSLAAALTLKQSPLLASARTAVTELWSSEREELPAPDTHREEIITRPVEETPLDAPIVADNGVTARTLVPTGTKGYTVWGDVYISNSTDHTLSTPPDGPFAAELTGETGPQVLILHSHGSEAYTPPEDNGIVWSGEHRTTDSRYNVVQVGEEIAGVLSLAGISVLHDRTLYDYPNYSGAYDRSLAAIRTYQAQYPTIRFVLDIHRDAIEDAQGKEYKVVSTVGEGEAAAQMTLVMGSDGSGLEHPDWMENLKLAAALQQDILSEYPTLMRPILLRNSRYNQHVSTGALLLEVGAAGNSPEEAVLAGRLFAEHMAEVLTARSK